MCLIVPNGYGISTSPQLSEQSGKAKGYAIAAAVIIVVNITPTQVTCTSIEWKPIAPLFSQERASKIRVLEVGTYQFLRCWTF